MKRLLALWAIVLTLAAVACSMPAGANGRVQRYVGVEAIPMYAHYDRQPIIAFSLGGFGFYEPYSYDLDYYDDDFRPYFRGRRHHFHHFRGGHRHHFHRGHMGGHHFHRGGGHRGRR